MATITIKKGYLEILKTLGSADTIVEDALRKYLIDKCVERIEKSYVFSSIYNHFIHPTSIAI